MKIPYYYAFIRLKILLLRILKTVRGNIFGTVVEVVVLRKFLFTNKFTIILQWLFISLPYRRYGNEINNDCKITVNLFVNLHVSLYRWIALLVQRLRYYSRRHSETSGLSVFKDVGVLWLIYWIVVFREDWWAIWLMSSSADLLPLSMWYCKFVS